MIHRGPQLLGGAFAETEPSKVLLLALQEGSLVLARILKMSWVHDKVSVSIDEYNGFFTGDLPTAVVGLNMELELLREIGNWDRDIYSIVHHNRVQRTFMTTSLDSTFQVALQFVQRFYRKEFESLTGMHILSYYISPFYSCTPSCFLFI